MTTLLQVLRPAPNGPGGMTLSALMHDELYFLPAFLDHYRRLGVAHFALLDDASTDGSREYALEQPDVTLFQSSCRYGDMIAPPDAPDGPKEKAKMLWRRALLAEYGTGRWTLHLDLDEFIDLPEGLDFPALAGRLEAAGRDTVYGAMVDMYPGNLSDFGTMSDSLQVDLEAPWYFDAVPHVIALPLGTPMEVYGGLRGRLARRLGLPTPKQPPGRRLTNRLFGHTAPFLHRVRKVAMLKWFAGRRMRNEHKITPARPARMILPIRHYKFTPSLAAKTAFALDSGAYAKNSGQYRLIDRLLAGLAAEGGSFLGPESQPYCGFESFSAAGIARGF